MPQPPASGPTDLVVFGGTGDLAMRKLLPALHLLDRDGHLDAGTRVVAVSRDGLTDADLRDKGGRRRPRPPRGRRQRGA